MPELFHIDWRLTVRFLKEEKATILRKLLWLFVALLEFLKRSGFVR